MIQNVILMSTQQSSSGAVISDQCDVRVIMFFNALRLAAMLQSSTTLII
jgi:hypothetical protein